MKLLLSSLLLASLCDLSSWSVSSTGTVVVTQPRDISVMLGGTVNITCCWTAMYERVRIYWLKNLTDIMNDSQSQGSMQKESRNCSTLTITNIIREDSGIYVCQVTVEIPYLKKVKGNGTVITVRDNIKDETAGEANSTSLSNPLPMIITLSVVAPVLLLTLVCFCILRRRQAPAARVIYEVPHIDSEEADMDKHSTSSSRGSSQWCQVPVYESFDYFEHVERKQSG